MTIFRNCLIAFSATLVLAGCTTPRLLVPPPAGVTTRADAQNSTRSMIEASAATRPDTMQRDHTPTVPGQSAGALVAGVAGEPLPPLKGGAVNVNIEGMPVPAFINEFFGAILGVGFQMDTQVGRMNDLVTLRTSGPQSPQEFYRLATSMLRTYGVSAEYTSGMVMFTRAQDGGGSIPPLIVSGRALPEVPISHRPVFQLVELQSVRANDVVNLLNIAFKGNSLQVQPDNNRNAIVLMGKPEMVRQALDAIRVFDRPYMRGRESARLEPAFVGADELSKRLVEVLGAEGYGAALYSSGSVSSTAVLVLPLTAANAVLVFASDRQVLEHAVEWARSIDRPNPVAGGDGLFYYMVKNTQAKEIVATISGVRGRGDGVRTPARNAIDGSEVGVNLQPVIADENADTNASSAAGDGDLTKGKLLLDEPRNALIYQGNATDWARLLPLIQQMDKAPRQVMIEVTVAEVTLSKDEDFGVAWLAKNDIGKFDGRVSSGTIGGLGGSGLNYLLDIGGSTRASLKALASRDRISILSTPRLMVKSGEEASIDVGTEVPTISSQSTSPLQSGGTSNILQTVQYRKTGILLNIKPVVYSDDRVDLELRQEVSEAQPLGSNAAVNSPAIFNRSVSTSLSLKDGSAILIGGLMSQKNTDSDSGIPFLKDIPLLGHAFKSTTRNNNKTELVLMIVPYIIETDTQADELTRSLSQRFELLDLPYTPAPDVPVTPSTRVGDAAPAAVKPL